MNNKDKNQEIIRQYVDELNKRNFAILDELVSEDVTAPGIQGLNQYREQIKERIEKFPNYHVTIEKIEIKEDRVILYWKRQGTSIDGEILDESAVSTYRIVEGKIVEVT